VVALAGERAKLTAPGISLFAFVYRVT